MISKFLNVLIVCVFVVRFNYDINMYEFRHSICDI